MERWRLLQMGSFLLWVALVYQRLELCVSINAEGRALLRFKERVEVDPHGALSNWKEGDADPCSWFGAVCSDDGRVVAPNVEFATIRRLLHQSPLPTPAPAPSFSPNKSLVPTLTSATDRGKHVTWIILGSIGGASILLVLSAIYLLYCRAKRVVTVMPWTTGLRGQLQKSFLTGVPSLRRSELEIACEDFSNIIGSLSDCTLYKGTLSSGVEIAVTSTIVTSAKDWLEQYQAPFRKKISVLSEVNHKNFMSLLGFCEEEEPLTRMMVFEYAPNGTLFEHLHVKEAEQLDWAARLRIAMGVVYCLEYMHGLDPPVVLRNLNSSSIYLTEDYAAKISDLGFFDEEKDPESVADASDQESIVYKFGIMLLEIISGRLPFSKDDGLLVLWASAYLTGKRPLRNMADPSLRSVREEDISALCEVIRSCINPEPKKRPTIAEVANQMRLITAIPPDEATPKLSPLWWADLEIASS
ncbi:protein MALE DISCOVERER 2 [Phoenix dactylifera]|uniref:Protein MALE DISCOVERER 2 n=1 Tax=Phoenix dactylifera TaxID=42345 RepID=A0A8B7D2H1_PHODC|nr:protein MALE DISCOVERER 2 [Phoenix dactylifera]